MEADDLVLLITVIAIPLVIAIAVLDALLATRGSAQRLDPSVPDLGNGLIAEVRGWMWLAAQFANVGPRGRVYGGIVELLMWVALVAAFVFAAEQTR